MLVGGYGQYCRSWPRRRQAAWASSPIRRSQTSRMICCSCATRLASQPSCSLVMPVMARVARLHIGFAQEPIATPLELGERGQTSLSRGSTAPVKARSWFRLSALGLYKVRTRMRSSGSKSSEATDLPNAATTILSIGSKAISTISMMSVRATRS